MSETEVVETEGVDTKSADETDAEAEDTGAVASDDDGAAEAEVVSLSSEEDELEVAKRDAEDWRARAYRSAANLDNARKRFQKERDDLRKYGAEGLLKDILPVADNLERALEHAAADDGLTEGVEMVLRQVMQA